LLGNAKKVKTKIKGSLLEKGKKSGRK